MTAEFEPTNAELARTLVRIEQSFKEYREGHHRQIENFNVALGVLSNKIDQYIGPVAVLTDKISGLKDRLEEHKERLEDHDKDILEGKIGAAKISAIGVLLALASSIIPLPWKR